MVFKNNAFNINSKVASNSFNKSKSWNSSFSLGLEVWQIFIVLTIILTISSALMWFTNLQPETLKQEYLLIDKTKSEIFNKAERIKYSMSTIVFPENLKASNEICYKDIAVETFNKQNYLEQLISEEKELSSINTSVLNQVNTLSNSGLAEVMKYSLDYSVESKLDIEKAHLYFNQINKINEESIQLCNSTLDKVPSINSNLDILLKNDIINEYNPDVVSLSLNMLTASKSISESALISQKVSTEDKESFIKNFTAVLTSRPDSNKFLSKSKEKYEDLMLKIDNLESWQKKFTNEKRSSVYKTVWVLSKNKE